MRAHNFVTPSTRIVQALHTLTFSTTLRLGSIISPPTSVHTWSLALSTTSRNANGAPTAASKSFQSSTQKTPVTVAEDVGEASKTDSPASSNVGLPPAPPSALGIASSASPWSIRLSLDISNPSGSNVEVLGQGSGFSQPQQRVPPPTSAVAAFGYNYVFYRNDRDQLSYAKFKDGSAGSNLRVRVSGDFVSVGRGGIEAVVVPGSVIRVYLIRDDYLTEYCLDSNDDDAWYKGDLAKAAIEAGKTSLLSAVPLPLRVYFQGTGNSTLLSYAFYGSGGWNSRQLKDVEIPAK